MKKIKLHKDYTINQREYQLKISIELEYKIPANDSVRLLSQIIEEIDLTELYQTYYRINEKKATPRQMLKIILYAYMNEIYSSRGIEKACQRDINFMYLLEGAKRPDHSTIARFRQLHFAPYAKLIMARYSNKLFELGEISGENIFIDGSKVEANASRYTFVWKRAVTKNLAKLLQKLADFVAKCELEYGIEIVYKNIVKMRHVKKLRKKLYTIKKQDNITFVYGKGKRKNPLQRAIEQLEDYLKKLKDYTKKLFIAEKRNSYSKTDNDATFMRMKEDHMRNGQLKPAYNIQHGVDAGYITWLTVSQKPADVHTLIPFLEEAESYLDFKYKNIIVDAGYESEENYMFIERNRQVAYLKPTNYEISKTRKYKKDIGRFENMSYDKDSDSYICKNKKRLVVTGTRMVTNKSGYSSEKTQYTCEDCTNCHYKTGCIKGNNSKIPLSERTKRLEIAKLFHEKRQESLARITSSFGCLLRVNRSIQAEGSFANTKHNMKFRRFLSRGLKNVLAESILLAIAHNTNKLHNKIQSGRTGMFLHQLIA